MSSRPVSREVYWRRRLLALALLIAIIWGIVQLVGLFTGGDDKEDSAAKPTKTEASKEPESGGKATEPEATAEPEPEPDDAGDGQVMVDLTTSPEACDPSNVAITPTVPNGQPNGKAVAVDLLISTIDGSACTFSPSSDSLLVVIEAKKAAVYDSQVCRDAFLSEKVSLSEGWATQVRTHWSGKGSGSACSPKEGFATPGTYTFKIGALGGEPGETSFTLS